MKVYRILAYTIAVLVVVQVMAIAWAFFGLTAWITDDGGVVNKAYLESEGDEMQFTAEWGFAIHMFFNGMVLIPLVSLALLITSFFAKVPRGILWALGIFGLIVLQVILLPMLSSELGAGFGALHGLNALVLLALAIQAGRRAAPASIPAAAAADRSVTA